MQENTTTDGFRQKTTSSLYARKGDTLFAYTDGLTDIQNPRGIALGDSEILKLVQSDWDTADNLIGSIEDKLFNHMGDSPQFDDMTFWIVQRNP